jgi:hypothetical protein
MCVAMHFKFVKFLFGVKDFTKVTSNHEITFINVLSVLPVEWCFESLFIAQQFEKRYVQNIFSKNDTTSLLCNPATTYRIVISPLN